MGEQSIINLFTTREFFNILKGPCSCFVCYFFCISILVEPKYFVFFYLKKNFQDSASYGAVAGIDSGNASDEDSQNEGITGCPVQREMLPRAVQQMVWNCHLNSCYSCRVRL